MKTGIKTYVYKGMCDKMKGYADHSGSKYTEIGFLCE